MCDLYRSLWKGLTLSHRCPAWVVLSHCMCIPKSKFALHHINQVFIFSILSYEHSAVHVEVWFSSYSFPTNCPFFFYLWSQNRFSFGGVGEGCLSQKWMFLFYFSHPLWQWTLCVELVCLLKIEFTQQSTWIDWATCRHFLTRAVFPTLC